jgi:hypothetical protein
MKSTGRNNQHKGQEKIKKIEIILATTIYIF